MATLMKLFSGRTLLTLVVMLGLASGPLSAKSTGMASFTGSWSGSGVVGFSGKPEPIDCRVSNVNKAGNTFYSTFSCSMDAYGSGRLTIMVEKMGANLYRGSFYDEQNQVRVYLSGRIHGDRMKVDLSSKKWKGVIYLRK